MTWNHASQHHRLHVTSRMDRSKASSSIWRANLDTNLTAWALTRDRDTS
jgi:hypothetical protein